MIIKFDKFLNESLKDKMTGKSNDEIIDIIGEENYEIYKKVSNVIKTIKTPFYTKEIKIYEPPYRIIVQSEYNEFFIEYFNNKWNVNSTKNGLKTFDTWDKVLNFLIEETIEDFNDAIEYKKDDIKIIEQEIDDIKNLIEEIKINYNNE